MRHLLACACLLLLAGCSFTFDDSPPVLPLLGQAPPTAQLPRLNRGPASTVSVVYAQDNTPWAVFTETVSFVQQLRFVHLAEPPLEETLPVSDDVIGNYDAYYLEKKDQADPMNGPLELTIHFVGGTPADTKFALSPGPGVLFPSSANDLFVWWPARKDTTAFLIQRRDGSFSRVVPLPDGATGMIPFPTGRPFFLPGNLFVTRDGNKVLVTHSTTSEKDTPLGVRPDTLAYDRARKALITCGTDGVRSVPVDASPERVLDPDACDETQGLGFHRGRAVYVAGHQLRSVPLDGSQAPSVLLPAGERVLAFGPNDEIVFSTDSEDKYVTGAGDGWLGDWRFMDRGHDVRYSDDNTRLRWLEHSAKPSGVGDLESALVPKGAQLTLARNVRQWEELSDGRILAVDDHAFRGEQNRVVVIDEQAGAAHWVAAQSHEYVHVPGTDDLLVDVVTGATTYDIVRVTVPPR